MKAELIRVAITTKNAAKAKEDFEKLLGVTFYGPYDDKSVGLSVALPRRGGIEVFSPTRDDDAVGATQKLAERGEGISGIALRVDDIEEAERHMASLGLTPNARITHGAMKELLYFAQEATHGVEIALNEYPDANGCAIEVARDMGADV